jgi:hypothetical protein
VLELERRFDALRVTPRSPFGCARLMTDGSVEIGKAKRMAIDRPIEPRDGRATRQLSIGLARCAVAGDYAP